MAGLNAMSPLGLPHFTENSMSLFPLASELNPGTSEDYFEPAGDARPLWSQGAQRLQVLFTEMRLAQLAAMLSMLMESTGGAIGMRPGDNLSLGNQTMNPNALWNPFVMGYGRGGSPGQGVSTGDIPPAGAPGVRRGGTAAVQIAESKLGQASIDVNLPNYSHAGGVSNDCADFASACIANAGLFRKTASDVNVGQLSQDLRSQGWRPVSKATAQPGDVAIVNGDEHAEVVANSGATECIGSNNGGTSTQSIRRDDPSTWGSVVYWAPPKAG